MAAQPSSSEIVTPLRPQISVVGLGSITAAAAIADAATGPARRVVIDPLVAREETTMLHSQPRDGKTWFLLAAALAITSGGKLAGRFETTEQTSVLYATNEDGQRQIARRLQMLMNGLTMKSEPDGLRLFVGRGLWLDDPHWQARLIAEVRAFRIGVVIYEPLRSVTACVDRGPADLQPLARFERQLINETSCAIVRGHHETKPLTGVPEDRRPAQRSSGGGLFSISDALISIERIDDTKSRFVPDGFKHCDTPAPFIVERLVFDGATYLNISDAPDRQTGADLALLDEVREELRLHPNSSGRQVEKHIHKQADKVRSALAMLRDAGEARCEKKGAANRWSLV